MSRLLKGLNSSQREAVTHRDGPLLIIAGPGSGKTETVARSIVYAIEEREVGPSRIAAFTFTNKAKDDLKERISKKIVRQDLVNDIWIRTFHSFCGHVWNKHPRKLVIENEKDFTAEELTRVYRSQITHLQYHQFDDKEIFNFIREYENQDISLTKVGNLQLPQIYIDIHKKYTQILKDNNDIYTKIQLFTNALLRDVHEVKTEWQEKFELIFVDEFQDTDPIQYQIIKTLAGTRQNLRVVGDDDQGIYGWRGADIQNILNFENDYRTDKPITLGQNYRSTQKIVEASRALVEFNPDRREKDLFTKNFKGEKVKHLHCENADVEANTIADFISRAIQEGQNPSDFAVLYRTRAQAYTLEEAFSNRTPKIRYYNLDKKGNLLSKQPKCTISLMTIHKSKGLEFPNVFVSGVCSGLLPLYKSKKDWDEELRLLYVAMTRAENWLCLSSYGPHGRSEFLSYIPSSLLKTIEPLDNIRIPPKPKKMERPVTKESSDYEQLPEKLLGAGMTVIGIDPGNVGAWKTNVGWSVTQKTSDGYSVLDYNTEHPIGTKEDKLKEIERKINSLVTFPPDAIDAIDAIAVEKIEVAIGEVEDTIEKAKAQWFHYVASCVATIRNIADRHEIECRLYTAQDVKYAATDNSSANKEQVKSGVKKRCSVLMVKNNKKIDDHSADAIAASLCYLRSHLNSSRYEGNKRKEEHWNNGCAYLDKSQYNAAVSEFREAIKIDPIYPDAHCGLGRAYLAQGALKAAENVAKTALRFTENNHPDSQKLLDAIDCYRSGRNAVNNKQFNEAITEFRESINLEPFFFDAHYELSRVHLRLSNLQVAKYVIEEALKLADDYLPIQQLSHAISLYNAGINFLNARRYHDAIDKFKETIDREPTFTEAHYSLGCAYFQSEALEASEQSAKDTLELNNNHQLACVLLDDIKRKYNTQGFDFIASGMYANAIEPLQKACALNPNDQEVWANLGRAYYLIDEYINAASCYRKVTDLDPKDKNAYSNLGNAYFRMGAYADAIEPLQEACALNPNCGKFHYYLGRAQFELDKLGEAKWAVKKALESDQTHHPAIKLLKKIEKRSHEIIKKDNPDMILIPAGEFQMGCGARDAPSNEKPIHTVYLDDFYIDKYPVTNAQYKRFIDANSQWRKDHIPRKYHNGGYLKHWKGNNYLSGTANHPVVHVSWYAAMAYAQWVGKRLPTEAEWEKAARGGLVSQIYPWGNLIDSSKANYSRNVRRTTSVGDYPANNYGLYDMAGNVWEWCLDRYNEDFYVKSPCHNPVAGGTLRYTIDLFRNVKSSRVLRGGSWSVEPQDVRSTARTWKSPNNPCPDLGFRCVMFVIP